MTFRVIDVPDDEKAEYYSGIVALVDQAYRGTQKEYLIKKIEALVKKIMEGEDE